MSAVVAIAVIACGGPGKPAVQPVDPGGADDTDNVGSDAAAADSPAPAPAPAPDPAAPFVEDDDEPAPGDPPRTHAACRDAATRTTKIDDRFQTSQSREELSAFLVKPAAAAMNKRQYPLAVSLYDALVEARGPGDDVALQLAKAWQLDGRYDEAVSVYRAFADTTTDVDKCHEARREADRLAAATAPFSGRAREMPAAREAREAFKRGREAFKKKRYADALVYYQMGARLDPDLPGFARELGATYDKLGAEPEKIAAYQEYLRRRPIGKNSDAVRDELRKVKGADKDKLLGTVTLSTVLPCEEVWVERQLVPDKLPLKKLVLAPGTYKWLCYNGKYRLAHFETTTVEPGKHLDVTFRWAIVVNKLQNPYGRIVLENPFNSDVMQDLGIETSEVGVPIPPDGRRLQMILKSDDGSRREERLIKLEPGAREEIKWK